MKKITALFNALLRFTHKLEDLSLVLLLLALLTMGIVQIVARNAGLSGFIWFDTAARIIVLWLALFGAMRASRLQNHIAIDLISHYCSLKTRRIIHFITSISAASVCAFSAWFSYLFIVSEYEYPSTAFLNVPSWACESIIPFSLAVISLRFAYYSLSLPPANTEEAA
ncbi:MAG: TRAP transporter small permease [Sinobacterium sp.]|nr:TRAP transporter small permease [Sinobacterium sp.]